MNKKNGIENLCRFNENIITVLLRTVKEGLFLCSERVEPRHAAKEKVCISKKKKDDMFS